MKRAELLDALGGVQVEADAAVDAALAEVAVERRVVAVLVEQLAQVAQVVADLVRRHGRVLPARPGVGLAGHPGGRAQAALAHLPDHLLLAAGRRTASSTAGSPASSSIVHAAAGLGVGVLLAVAAELDQQAALARRQQGEVGRPRRPSALTHSNSRWSSPSRAVGLNARISIRWSPARVDVRVAEDQQRARLRVGHQVQRRFQDGDQRALRADQGPGDVEAVLRQQRVRL